MTENILHDTLAAFVSTFVRTADGTVMYASISLPDTRMFELQLALLLYYEHRTFCVCQPEVVYAVGMWNTAQESYFIDCVRNNRCLWDPRFPDYAKRHSKSLAMNNIGLLMKINFPEDAQYFSDEELRKKWGNLRTYKIRLMREKKTKRNGPGSNIPGKIWDHTDEMEFIRDIITADPPSSSNLPEKQVFQMPQENPNNTSLEEESEAVVVDIDPSHIKLEVPNSATVNAELLDQPSSPDNITNSNIGSTNDSSNINQKTSTSTSLISETIPLWPWNPSIPKRNSDSQLQSSNPKKSKPSLSTTAAPTSTNNFTTTSTFYSELTDVLRMLVQEVNSVLQNQTEPRHEWPGIFSKGGNKGMGLCASLLDILNNEGYSERSRNKLTRQCYYLVAKFMEEQEVAE